MRIRFFCLARPKIQPLRSAAGSKSVTFGPLGKKIYIKRRQAILEIKAYKFLKWKKTVSDKNSYISAIKLYNSLPKELKTFNVKDSVISKKLKKWFHANYLPN